MTLALLLDAGRGPRATMTDAVISRGLDQAAKSGAGASPSRPVRGWLFLTLVLVVGAPLAVVVAQNAAWAAPTASVAKVSITGTGFSPAVVVVVIRTTVQWKNDDTLPHSLKGQVTSPAVLKPGATYQRKFTSPGEYPYFDGTHPDNTGTVVVIAGSSSLPPAHGNATYHYTANLTLVVSENWTYYTPSCECTTPPCNGRIGTGERVVHLSVRFPTVTYDRYPSLRVEDLYSSNAPGRFGKTTETVSSLISTTHTAVIKCDGGDGYAITQKQDCDRNFTGKSVLLSLAWGPSATKNNFLVTDYGPRITPGSCYDNIGEELVSRF